MTGAAVLFTVQSWCLHGWAPCSSSSRDAYSQNGSLGLKGVLEGRVKAPGPIPLPLWPIPPSKRRGAHSVGARRVQGVDLAGGHYLIGGLCLQSTRLAHSSFPCPCLPCVAGTLALFYRTTRSHTHAIPVCGHAWK